MNPSFSYHSSWKSGRPQPWIYYSTRDLYLLDRVILSFLHILFHQDPLRMAVIPEERSTDVPITKTCACILFLGTTGSREVSRAQTDTTIGSYNAPTAHEIRYKLDDTALIGSGDLCWLQHQRFATSAIFSLAHETIHFSSDNSLGQNQHHACDKGPCHTIIQERRP